MAGSAVVKLYDPLWDGRFSEELQTAPVSCRHLMETDYSCETHRHLGIEFIYCLSGEGVFNVNGHQFPYRAPALIHFEGQIPHNVSVHGKYERWNICIEPNALQKVLGKTAALANPASLACPSGIRMVQVTDSHANRLERVFTDIAGELTEQKIHYQEMVSLRLKELSVLFDRFARETGLVTRFAQQTDQQLDLRAYIEANLAEDITAVSLASTFHYSEKHVYRVIRRLTGHSLGEYLKARRIERACNLLEATNLPITSVGEAVGIFDPSQFSRVFRDVIGVSPSKYRKIREQA